MSSVLLIVTALLYNVLLCQGRRYAVSVNLRIFFSPQVFFNPHWKNFEKNYNKILYWYKCGGGGGGRYDIPKKKMFFFLFFQILTHLLKSGRKCKLALSKNLGIVSQHGCPRETKKLSWHMVSTVTTCVIRKIFVELRYYKYIYLSSTNFQHMLLLSKPRLIQFPTTVQVVYTTA